LDEFVFLGIAIIADSNTPAILAPVYNLPIRVFHPIHVIWPGIARGREFFAFNKHWLTATVGY
jgi:hypothetical protein